MSFSQLPGTFMITSLLFLEIHLHRRPTYIKVKCTPGTWQSTLKGGWRDLSDEVKSSFCRPLLLSTSRVKDSDLAGDGLCRTCPHGPRCKKWRGGVPRCPCWGAANSLRRGCGEAMTFGEEVQPCHEPFALGVTESGLRDPGFIGERGVSIPFLRPQRRIGKQQPMVRPAC